MNIFLQVGRLKTHETNSELSLEAKVRDIKNITNIISHKPVGGKVTVLIFTFLTSVDSFFFSTEKRKPIFGKWSKWSRCIRCRKTRRKKCMSPACKSSILYEQRPCRNKRCKRKRKKIDRTKILFVSYH